MTDPLLYLQSAPDRQNKQRTVFLVVSAVVAVAVVVVAHEVMLPFVLALIIAYVLTPFVRRVERNRIPRWVAVLLVYAVTIGSLAGFAATIVPRLIAEGQALRSELPNLSSRVRKDWLPAVDARIRGWTGQHGEPPSDSASQADTSSPPALRVVPARDGAFEVHLGPNVQFRESQGGTWRIEQLEARQAGISTARMLEEGFDKGASYLRENSVTLLKVGQAVIGAISRGIFVLFMTLMLAAYLMLTRERIVEFFRELWLPESRPAFDRFLRRLDRGLSGVVRGQLLICVVNGVLSAIGFWIFDLKYWPIMAIIAAVMSLIPIFGSILSSVPAVAIGLTQSPLTGFWVLAWIVGIHQLEANFLNPKIIGDSAKIHPVLVVFSLLVGEHFFQIAGALFAVPCLSIVQTLFLHFRESTLGLRDPTSSLPPMRMTLAVDSKGTPGAAP